MPSARAGAPLKQRIVVSAALLLSLLASADAFAAQIVTLDMKPSGGVPPRVAESLSPVLVAELSRREGMSIISQADVRALLELESDKQLLGCSDASCMTDIAGSLGAELLCTSTVGRVGAEYVVTLTLIQVQGAKVARRSTARAKGGEEAASEALLQAIHELFKGGLPTELQGPASMTRRGFEAALAGLHSAVLDKKGDPRDSRKRIILDLVATELDYDATPKMDALDLALRRGRAEATRRALAARSKQQRDHFVAAREHYAALWDDLGRVKEIRTRARERGVVPSARPLRFLDPDPAKEPEPKDVRRYERELGAGQKIVERAIAAYAKGDEATFVSLWKSDYAGNAKRAFDEREYDDKRGIRYGLLPLYAATPELLERAISTLDEGRLVVYRRKLKDGKVEGEENVWLVQEDGRWRISSW